jgi:hypothetical protein
MSIEFVSCTFMRASVIAARKSLHVVGSFRVPPPSLKEREAERRKAHLGNSRGLARAGEVFE